MPESTPENAHCPELYEISKCGYNHHTARKSEFLLYLQYVREFIC